MTKIDDEVAGNCLWGVFVVVVWLILNNNCNV